MKRFTTVIGIILSFGIIICLFCGCNKTDENKVVEATSQESCFRIEAYELTAKTPEAAKTETTEPSEEKPVVDNKTNIVEEPVVAHETTTEDSFSEYELVYHDSNIRVTYVGYEVKAYGPVIYFNIENFSDKALTVLCTDVYIDGCRVYHSGLTCEKLAAGSETVEEFVLLPEDNTDVYNVDKVSFIIKLVNAKSYLDLYESGYITLDI